MEAENALSLMGWEGNHCLMGTRLQLGQTTSKSQRRAAQQRAHGDQRGIGALPELLSRQTSCEGSFLPSFVEIQLTWDVASV